MPHTGGFEIRSDWTALARVREDRHLVSSGQVSCQSMEASHAAWRLRVNRVRMNDGYVHAVAFRIDGSSASAPDHTVAPA